MADSILRLKVESQEYDAKLKRATEGLQRYVEGCRKAGGTLEVVEKDTLDFVKALGQMDTVSKTASGRLGELTKTFTELRFQYMKMTEAEKQSPLGKALNESLAALKTRIADTKKDLSSIGKELSGSKFGRFGSVIDTIGQKMGVTGNLTEMLTSRTAMLTGAVGAGIAIVGKATEAWASYNSELARQDNITHITTGLDGDGANRMTDTMRALADTYNVDFREAVKAANTLMAQFGKSGDDAIQLIKDGMRGMIQGDGPKLLSMIQKYAPAFHDAGVSASQLVAIIQNTGSGIFTEQNMNAIVFGIKNIRLMSESTSQALAQLGIDGEAMTKQLNDGTLNVFDALKQVADQLQKVDSNSQTAGEVMQQVFGRQGVTAGTNIAKAISTLNVNLDETKKKTGEVGDALDDLQTANEKLNIAIRDCFEYDGWDKMAKGIQSKLVTALANVIQMIADIKRELGGGWDTPKNQTVNNRRTGGGSFIDDVIKGLGNGSTPGQQRMFENQLNAYTEYATRLRREKNKLIEEANSDTSGVTWQINQRTIRELENMAKAAEKNRDEYMRRANELFKTGAGKTFNGREWVKDPNWSVLTEQTITPITATKTTGGGGGGHVDMSPAQQAAADVSKAMKDYANTLTNAQEKLDSSMITNSEYDRQINKGQQRLADAYLKAYNATGDPQYLAAFKGTAEDYNKLRATIDENVRVQKESAGAAKKLNDAQAKLAESQKAMADAQKSGDLKEYYKAQERVEQAREAFRQAGGTTTPSTIGGRVWDALPQDAQRKVSAITVPLQFDLTQDNIAAFIGNLDDQIKDAPFGSTLFQNLTAQMADATTLKSMMEVAMQNGIDAAEFDPQQFWQKIFGENPGDYISDETWQNLIDKFNEELKKAGKKPITIDFATGKSKGDKSGKEEKSAIEVGDQLVGGIKSMVSNLENIGIEIPQGFKDVVSGMDSVLGILNSIQVIVSAINSVNAISGLFGAGTAAAGAATGGAAGGGGLLSNFFGKLFGFANGGVVRAANGFAGIVPGNYGYDAVPALLTSGEVVLNRAQVGNLASQLEGGGLGALEITGILRGEDIALAIDNRSRRTGRGEYVTTNRR